MNATHDKSSLIENCSFFDAKILKTNKYHPMEQTVFLEEFKHLLPEMNCPQNLMYYSIIRTVSKFSIVFFSLINLQLTVTQSLRCVVKLNNLFIGRNCKL